MHWILDENRYNEPGIEELKRVLRQAEIPFSEHQVVPFSHELKPNIDPPGKVIVMGSMGLGKVAVKRGWSPGCYINDNFNFTSQVEHWGTAMLNYGATVCRFGDLSFTGERFIRPLDDSKLFSGRLIYSDEFEVWQHAVVDLGHDLW